jgi:hypothetical protein
MELLKEVIKPIMPKTRSLFKSVLKVVGIGILVSIVIATCVKTCVVAWKWTDDGCYQQAVETNGEWKYVIMKDEFGPDPIVAHANTPEQAWESVVLAGCPDPNELNNE